MITEQPERCGMLDMGSNHGNGLYRCCSCGWEGIPTCWRGEILSECPRCEGFGDEPDLRTHTLRHDIRIRPRVIHAPSIPKQGRNEPCACGSGKKFKKCHGA